MAAAPQTSAEEKKNPWMGAVASILPGLGQIYTEQVRKGVVLVIVSVFLLYVIVAYRSIASELADALYVALLLYGAYDSYNTAKMINEGLA
jgi:TM2 domain-containing membrane protein YozV